MANKRRKARPLLLAAAGAASLILTGCKEDPHPTGNLLAAPYDAGADLSVTVDMSRDGAPSGNLMGPAFDMAKSD